MAPSTLRYWTVGPVGGAGRSRSSRSTSAVCSATYAAPAASVYRRTVVASTPTPQKKASSAAACSNGIFVPSYATHSAGVSLASPGRSSRSSSGGEKTGSTLGAHGVAAIQFQRRALSGWSDRPPLAAARLQLTTACRARRSFCGWLRGHVGGRARLYHLLQRQRLQPLPYVEHHRFNLRQGRPRVGPPPGGELLGHTLGQCPPARQHPLHFFPFVHCSLPTLVATCRDQHCTGFTQNSAGHPSWAHLLTARQPRCDHWSAFLKAPWLHQLRD